VKYDNSFIKNCPFYFTVSKEPLVPQIKSELSEPNEIQLNHSNSNSLSKLNNSNEKMNMMATQTITAGRGRIIRQICNNRQEIGKHSEPLNGTSVCGLAQRSSGNIQTTQSQKRKSPLACERNDVEMRDISTKLKRVVVDETNNTYFQFPNGDYESIVRQSIVQSNVYSLDKHLRKHSSIKFGDIPSLKCKFISKYANGLSFPIGVAIFMPYNWAFVADSGNHCVKIFNSINGELIRALGTGSGNNAVHFKRPSAIYVNSYDAELYVKDDKEIQVFDLNNDFKLTRKIGTKKLVRPYGKNFDCLNWLDKKRQ
jgi:hypothetical protein